MNTMREKIEKIELIKKIVEVHNSFYDKKLVDYDEVIILDDNNIKIKAFGKIVSVPSDISFDDVIDNFTSRIYTKIDFKTSAIDNYYNGIFKDINPVDEYLKILELKNKIPHFINDINVKLVSNITPENLVKLKNEFNTINNIMSINNGLLDN